MLVFVLLLPPFSQDRAPEVFLAPYIYTTFLSTLPPLILLATGLYVRHRRWQKSIFPFPRSSPFPGFVFAVLFKEYDLGWIAVIAGLASGVFGRLPQRPHHCEGRHSIVHDDARHCQFFWAGMATVLSGGKSYALRESQREAFRMAMDRPDAPSLD